MQLLQKGRIAAGSTRPGSSVAFPACSAQLQDLAGFLLHGAAVFGSADFELAFGGFWKLTDGDTSHAINDSIAIIDGTGDRLEG